MVGILHTPDQSPLLAMSKPERTKSIPDVGVLGVVCILLTVVTNVALGELTQAMESPGIRSNFEPFGAGGGGSNNGSSSRSKSRHGFNQPVLIVFCNHRACSVLLAAGVCVLRAQRLTLAEALANAGMSPSLHSFGFTCAALSVLYKFNVLWSLALPHTSVTIFTSISQSNCVLVFVFSVCMLGEQPHPLKVASVLVSLGGVALVVAYGSDRASSSAETPTTALGVFYSVLFTCGLAYYTVIYKKWVGKAAGAHVAISLVVLGGMGIFTAVACWPLLPVARWLGLETGELPAAVATWQLWGLCTGVAIACNVVLMVALCATTPLMVSIGSMLKMPASAVVDVWLHHDPVAWQELLGCALIAAGFVLLSAGGQGGAGAGAAAAGSTAKVEHDRTTSHG